MNPRRRSTVLLVRSGALLAGVALLAGCSASPAGAGGASTPTGSPSTDTATTVGGSAADRMDSATEEANTRLVEGLFTDAFPDPTAAGAVAAADDLVAEDAVAHGDGAAPGPQGLLDQFAAAQERVPGAQAVIKRTAADGDLVAVHWQLATDPDDERTGEAAVDLFRVADGRIVERWSFAQPIAEGVPASGNTNTMFSDLYTGGGAVPDEQAEEENRELAVGAYDRLFRDQDVTVLDEAFDPAYLQHNPVAPNGTDALKSFFSGGASFPPQESTISLADGDLVWTFSQSVDADADDPVLAADIFRVDDGLIREHWDVVPAAPAN